MIGDETFIFASWKGPDTEGGRGLGTKEAMIGVLLVVYAGAVSS